MQKTLPLIATLAALAASPAAAQDVAAPVEAAAAVSADVAYIFNTLLFLIGGFLVMWMAAGFAMLEAGLVRSKNVTTQLFKNISLFAIAGIMYWLIGYNLMYPGDWTVTGYIGELFSPKAIDPVGAGLAEDG
ncbi:MAG: ammonium transporter, partial [Pseudomonadota bacterium]|nr:ammonium transporter [Pseudomonadota bacterium]